MTERPNITLPLVGNFPDDGPPWDGCVNPNAWSCWTRMGVEVEVANFLVALVLLLKPDVILETGTHLGVSTNALGAACRAMGKGHVWTLEPDEGCILVAKEVCLKAGVSPFVTFIQGESVEQMIAEHSLSGKIGFAFVDCGEPMRRRGEVAGLIEQHMKDHGVIAIHDTSEAWDKWGDGLRTSLMGYGLIHLPTPRGLTLLGPHL